STGADASFLAAVAGAVVASFSFLNGLLIWPVGGFLLFWRKDRNALASWCLSSVVLFLVYFMNWKRSGDLPGLSYAAMNPAGAAAYFLAYLGSPLGVGPWGGIFVAYSLMIGILLFALAAALVYFLLVHSLAEKCSIWLALILFWFLSAGISTIGRGGFGVEQALSSRYVTFGLPGIIGLYMGFLAIYKSRHGSRTFQWIFGVFLFVMAAGIVLGMAEGVVMGSKVSEDREMMRCTLLNYESASTTSLRDIYPEPQMVRRWAPFLRKNHLNVFAGVDGPYAGVNCPAVPRATNLYDSLLPYRDRINRVIRPS
ncbi:MAG: hypothetical protein LUQ25_07545, partial [Methanoregulaceae archaeon]|nr:hypothetical protein [Methanoregulaceae archaeon]